MYNVLYQVTIYHFLPFTLV